MNHTLFIVDYFSPHLGGVERLFYDIGKYCSDQGMRITVLTMRYDRSLAKIEKLDNMTIYRVGSHRRGILFAYLRFAWTHRGLFREVDHIHTSTYASCLPARCIAKLNNIPLSLTIHEFYDTLWYHLKGRKGIFYIWYERFITKLSWTALVTPSVSSKNTLSILYPHFSDNIIVILNQIDGKLWSTSDTDDELKAHIQEYYGLKPSDHIFLFVGRLGLEKGLTYLIEAYSQLTQEEKKGTWLVIIAPKTPVYYNFSIQQQIKSIDRQIRDNFLSLHTIWLDPVEDTVLKMWMEIADTGVVPSISEGFGYIAAQMQAMNLPLIASQTGSLPEILDHTRTIFVPYGKVEDIKYALLTRIHDTSGKINHTDMPPSPTDINYTSYYELFLHKKSMHI